MKYTLATIASVLLLSFPMVTFAAGLTQGQISAIISVLQAFGVDAQTVQNVNDILIADNATSTPAVATSTPPVNEVNTPPGFTPSPSAPVFVPTPQNQGTPSQSQIQQAVQAAPTPPRYVPNKYCQAVYDDGSMLNCVLFTSPTEAAAQGYVPMPWPTNQ